MAMPPGLDAAKMLKEQRAKKNKKPDAPGEDEAKAKDDMSAEREQALKSLDDALENTIDAPPKKEGGAAAGEAGEDKDPVQVFADVLDMTSVTAQAVYAEAMSIPELQDLSPEQMAKKINGDYEMLKKILTSMGEKAQAAMEESMNTPEVPPGGGPPGATDAPSMA